MSKRTWVCVLWCMVVQGIHADSMPRLSLQLPLHQQPLGYCAQLLRTDPTCTPMLMYHCGGNDTVLSVPCQDAYHCDTCDLRCEDDDDLANGALTVRVGCDVPAPIPYSQPLRSDAFDDCVLLELWAKVLDLHHVALILRVPNASSSSTPMYSNDRMNAKLLVVDNRSSHHVWRLPWLLLLGPTAQGWILDVVSVQNQTQAERDFLALDLEYLDLCMPQRLVWTHQGASFNVHHASAEQPLLLISTRPSWLTDPPDELDFVWVVLWMTTWCTACQWFVQLDSDDPPARRTVKITAPTTPTAPRDCCCCRLGTALVIVAAAACILVIESVPRWLLVVCLLGGVFSWLSFRFVMGTLRLVCFKHTFRFPSLRQLKRFLLVLFIQAMAVVCAGMLVTE